MMMMRLNRLIANVIFIVGVMTITAGCTTDAIEPTGQLNLSSTPPLVEQDTTSYTSKVTNTLGSYYDNTVTFLTDDCGIGAYSMATGKAVLYGVGGGLWGASKGSLYGIWAGDGIEGMVIGSIVGSTVGLAVGVKEAYDGFESDTAGCGTG